MRFSEEFFIVTIPITFPFDVTRGPPEFPGLAAAEKRSQSHSPLRCSGVLLVRSPLRITIPSPCALPTAKTDELILYDVSSSSPFAFWSSKPITSKLTKSLLVENLSMLAIS